MKPLRILYDFEAFSDQSYGGISRYILELARRIEGSDGTEVHLAAGWHRNQYLKAENPNWSSGRYFPAWPRTGEIRRRLNVVLMRRAIARFRPHIVHRTYHREAAAYPGGHATVATIHDLTYFLYPDSFPGGEIVRKRLLEVARTSDHLFCDSENTRKDAIRILGIEPDTATVVHLGVNPPTPASGPSPVAHAYLLFVGQRSGYKNFRFLLRSLAGHPLLKSLHLVVFGGGGFSPREQSEIKSMGLADRVVPLSGNDTRLADAYAHATALIYPSLYEGFGLPVLEAMAHGCPVICSNRSSLPEVGGDAAVYFDPLNAGSLALAIRKTVSDERFRKHLSDSGLARAQRFSWNACAQRTEQVYRRIVEGTPL